MAQTQILDSIGSLGGLANAATSLAQTLTGGAPGAWRAAIRQASFKGVPFAVLVGETAFGRKKSVHRYPQRDGVWVEDLGREARMYHLQAFLLEDDAIYGGGPVNQQRTRFIAAFEAADDGELVHPTLGRVTVAGLQAQCAERWDKGRYFELSLTFIEAGAQRFPALGVSTGNLLTQAISVIGSASLTAFVNDTVSALQYGSAVINANVNAALAWYTAGVGLVHDVKRFFGSVSTLVTSTESALATASSFGRYFGGNNTGYSAAPVKRTAPTTVAALIAQDAANRTALDEAGETLVQAAGNPADAATYTAAAQGLAGALGASAADPADRLRLITSLASFQANAPTTASGTGQAIATIQTAATNLFNRSALAALAAAAGAYQPVSQEDAASVSDQVTAMLDAAITTAGDSSADAVYNALCATKKAVIADLKARGGELAHIVPYHFNASLPALTLAQRIYRDAGRSDDLVTQAEPIHPAFMPVDFSALAS